MSKISQTSSCSVPKKQKLSPVSKSSLKTSPKSNQVARISPQSSDKLVKSPTLVSQHNKSLLLNNADANQEPSRLDQSDPSAGSAPMTIIGTVVHVVSNHQVWICPWCSKPDDTVPMIGCDSCDDWYHWHCVGINSEPPENQNW